MLEFKNRHNAMFPRMTWKPYEDDDIVVVYNVFNDYRVDVLSKFFWGYETEFGQASESTIVKVAKLGNINDSSFSIPDYKTTTTDEEDVIWNKGFDIFNKYKKIVNDTFNPKELNGLHCPKCNHILELQLAYDDNDVIANSELECLNVHCRFVYDFTDDIPDLHGVEWYEEYRKNNPKEIKRTQDFWDTYFMTMAKHVATASKDPSTKVGAVIVDQDNKVCGVGYNGFPKGFPDYKHLLEDREKKLDRVVHAEANAITNSYKSEGCKMYVYPLHCCNKCALQIASNGISEVISYEADTKRKGSKYHIAKEVFDKCGVEFRLFNLPL